MNHRAADLIWQSTIPIRPASQKKISHVVPIEHYVMHDLKQLYTIKQLSQKLNIPKPTLRFWEKELNGIIIPFRTPGGQRRYTVENLKVIKHIHRLRKEGMSILEIKRIFERRTDSQDVAPNSIDIDQLAEKIAQIVKAEVYKYFPHGCS
jgi:DNA-binding transcriptional MerR regulator